MLSLAHKKYLRWKDVADLDAIHMSSIKTVFAIHVDE